MVKIQTIQPNKKRFILKDAARENNLFINRVIVGWLFMLVCLSMIVVRLLYLQLFDHQQYTTLSDQNRIKILPISSSRGAIYDSRGRVLADNHVSYSLEVVVDKVEDADKTLDQLRHIITVTEEDGENFKKLLKQTRRFDSVLVRQNLSEDEVARFLVQRHNFPGMDVKANFTRYYPLGSIGAHVVGYVGRITEKELERVSSLDYQPDDFIGKTGVESFYEKELHGKVGIQKVEVNVQGRILRILEQTPPVPGKNIYLTIDMAFQKYVERVIRREKAAIVAIDPKTGGLLASASMPTYDPNLFVTGMDYKMYKKLMNKNTRPLFNRAIRGQYPPGSTVKPFVGLAGLEYGIRGEHSSVWCRGWYRLPDHPHKFRDWKRSGHGSVDLHRALERSCDVYFYDLAFDLGINRLHSFMQRFNFGKKTEIDIAGEARGLMPSREWKQEAHKKNWYQGETLIVGIGQGYTLATPLQLAVATAALSMKGQLRRPHVAFALDEPNTGMMKTVSSPPEFITLKHENYWDIVIQGMVAVVHSYSGTAKKAGQRSRYRFAGKTGTAQVIGIKQNKRYDARRLAKKYHDHALFIAFAPLHDPQIAISVIVENGGAGSRTAAPLARKVMDYYLLPNSPLKTASASTKL